MPQPDLQLQQNSAGNENMTAAAMPAVQQITIEPSTGENGDLLTRLQENLPTGYCPFL